MARSGPLPGKDFPFDKPGRPLRDAGGIHACRGAVPSEPGQRNVTMSVHPPSPLGTFEGNPVLRDVMGAAARDQARRGRLSGWLARRYAGVWPACDHDQLGELWRPVPGVERARRAFGDAGRE